MCASHHRTNRGAALVSSLHVRTRSPSPSSSPLFVLLLLLSLTTFATAISVSPSSPNDEPLIYSNNSNLVIAVPATQAIFFNASAGNMFTGTALNDTLISSSLLEQRLAPFVSMVVAANSQLNSSIAQLQSTTVAQSNTIASLQLSLASQTSRAVDAEASFANTVYLSLSSEASRAMVQETSMAAVQVNDALRNSGLQGSLALSLISVSASLGTDINLEVARATNAESSIIKSTSAALGLNVARLSATDSTLVAAQSSIVGTQNSMGVALGGVAGSLAANVGSIVSINNALSSSVLSVSASLAVSRSSIFASLSATVTTQASLGTALGGVTSSLAVNIASGVSNAAALSSSVVTITTSLANSVRVEVSRATSTENNISAILTSAVSTSVATDTSLAIAMVNAAGGMDFAPLSIFGTGAVPLSPAMWVMASYGITFGNGTKVAAWQDRVGNNNFVQANSTRQPTLVSNAINGRPALQFLAATQQTIVMSTSFVSSCSVFYVGRAINTPPLGTNARVLAGVANNWLLGWHGNFMDRAYFGKWITPDFAGFVGLPVNNTAYLYEAIINTTASPPTAAVYRNADLIASAATSPIYGPNGLQIGYQGGLMEYSDCFVAEIMVFTSAVTAQQRQYIERYFMSKYNLGD